MAESAQIPLKNDRSKAYRKRLNEMTFRFGVFGLSIATGGLAMTAFSGNPVYAACALLIAPFVIASVTVPKKRLHQRFSEQGNPELVHKPA